MQTTRSTRAVGYAFALCAGAIWGTTGPLSTLLYAEGAKLTAVGFWRITLATAGFLVYGLFARDLFKADRRGWLIVGLVGGLLVAVFEVGFQYAIAGVGIAPAVVMLYTAPIIVTLAARVILKEQLTPLRMVLAALVLAGVYLTVNGTVAGDEGATTSATRLAGIVGGSLAALSYAGTTILARFAVPRYGAVKVLFLEILGGTVILAAMLPLLGNAPAVPDTLPSWIYIAALGIGSVLAANFFFFAAARRIDAAPTAVGASVEPLVGALLGLLLFNQQLHWFGWLGLAMVMAGVLGGYKEETGEA